MRAWRACSCSCRRRATGRRTSCPRRERLGLDVTVASEEPSTIERLNPSGLLTLDFRGPRRRARERVAAFARDDSDRRRRRRGRADGRRRGGDRARASACRTTRSRRWRPRATRPSCGERLAEAGVLVAAPPALLDRGDDPRAAAAGGRVSVRPEADVSRGQPRRHPRRRPGAVRGGLAADRRDPRGSGRGARAAARRPREILVEDFVPGRRGRARGAADRGRAARARALRQARSARRAVLRGDDLRHALAACRAASRRRSRGRGAGARRAPSDCGTGRSTPSCACDGAGACVIEIAARSIGGLCSRTLRFGTGMIARGADPAPRARPRAPGRRARRGGRGRDDDPDSRGRASCEEVAGPRRGAGSPGNRRGDDLGPRSAQRLVPLPEGDRATSDSSSPARRRRSAPRRRCARRTRGWSSDLIRG